MPDGKEDRETITAAIWTLVLLAALGWAAAAACIAVADVLNVDQGWGGLALAIACTSTLLCAGMWRHRHRLDSAAANTRDVIVTYERRQQAAEQRVMNRLAAIDAELAALRELHSEMVRAVAGSVRMADQEEMGEQLARRDAVIFTVLREVAGRLPLDTPVPEAGQANGNGHAEIDVRKLAEDAFRLGRKVERRNPGEN